MVIPEKIQAPIRNIVNYPVSMNFKERIDEKTVKGKVAYIDIRDGNIQSEASVL